MVLFSALVIPAILVLKLLLINRVLTFGAKLDYPLHLCCDWEVTHFDWSTTLAFRLILLSSVRVWLPCELYLATSSGVHFLKDRTCRIVRESMSASHTNFGPGASKKNPIERWHRKVELSELWTRVYGGKVVVIRVCDVVTSSIGSKVMGGKLSWFLLIEGAVIGENIFVHTHTNDDLTECFSNRRKSIIC